jgi:His-Xaa-Ser system protein HxsD
MWPSIGTDVLGDVATVSVEPEVYSEAAIFKAAYWMTDRFYLFIDKRPSGPWLIEMRNKPGSSADLQQACAELCNSIIDFRLRDIVNKETLGIREALVKRAFVEGVPKPGLDGAISNEEHLAPVK